LKRENLFLETSSNPFLVPEKLNLSKSNIILVLVIIVVVLLGANIILEKCYPPGSSETELPSQIINSRFITALNNYDIDSTWIIKKDLSEVNDDSLKYFYSVKVPADLPISLLIKEIRNQFDSNEVEIYATDFKSDAAVEISINSVGLLKLKADMKSNDRIKRQTDSIAFMITDVEELNSESLSDLLMLPEHFSCILTPSKHSLEISKLIIENHKQTAILLGDDITELEFKLKSSYSKNRIINSLKSIRSNFGNATYFIIDEHSDIYKSQYYRLIKDWFTGEGLTTEEEFQEINSTNIENILSLLKSARDRKKLFRISAEDFMEMPQTLASLRKIGYKIVYPTELLDYQN